MVLCWRPGVHALAWHVWSTGGSQRLHLCVRPSRINVVEFIVVRSVVVRIIVVGTGTIVGIIVVEIIVVDALLWESLL